MYRRFHTATTKISVLSNNILSVWQNLFIEFEKTEKKNSLPIELPEVLSLLNELLRRTRSRDEVTLSWLVKREEISELLR